MTRVNSSIHPSELPNKLLLAEHREIKRIPNCVKKGRFNMAGQPEKFTLGPGHVKFFYDKLGYLLARYRSIREECLNRDFKVADYNECWDGIPDEYFGAYRENIVDRQIVLERIRSKGFDLIGS